MPGVRDCSMGSVPWRTLQEHLWTPVPHGQQDRVHVCPFRLEEVLLCGLLPHTLRPPGCALPPSSRLDGDGVDPETLGPPSLRSSIACRCTGTCAIFQVYLRTVTCGRTRKRKADHFMMHGRPTPPALAPPPGLQSQLLESPREAVPYLRGWRSEAGRGPRAAGLQGASPSPEKYVYSVKARIAGRPINRMASLTATLSPNAGAPPVLGEAGAVETLSPRAGAP